MSASTDHRTRSERHERNEEARHILKRALREAGITDGDFPAARRGGYTHLPSKAGLFRYLRGEFPDLTAHRSSRVDALDALLNEKLGSEKYPPHSLAIT